MSLETWTIVAIFSGPVVAVLISVGITIWHQKLKQRGDAQRSVFMTLMANRRAYPPPYDLVNSLNLIDVVFAGHPQVLLLWHNYYDLLHQTPLNHEALQHKQLDLLSEMAKSLGYKSLSQTDIDKFYSPIAHGESAELTYKTQKELLRVLQNTACVLVDKRDDEKPTS